MAETFSWLLPAVKAVAALAVETAAALVLAVLAKEAELEAKAVAALAVETAAQAEECSPDRAAKAANGAEPKKVRSAVPEAKAEKAAKAETEMAR